jgi:hypothetical protein
VFDIAPEFGALVIFAEHVSKTMYIYHTFNGWNVTFKKIILNYKKKSLFCTLSYRHHRHLIHFILKLEWKIFKLPKCEGLWCANHMIGLARSSMPSMLETDDLSCFPPSQNEKKSHNTKISIFSSDFTKNVHFLRFRLFIFASFK